MEEDRWSRREEEVLEGRGGRGLATRLGVSGGLTRSHTDRRWKGSSSTGLGVRGSLLDDRARARAEGRNFLGGSFATKGLPRERVDRGSVKGFEKKKIMCY